LIRELIQQASRSPAFQQHVAHSAVLRRASRRFLPGEELDDALRVATELWAERIPTVLTCLGESVTSPDAAAAASLHYVDVLRRIEDARLPTDVSVKLSHLGLAFGVEACLENVIPIAAEAKRAGRTLWLDIEDSSTTEATLATFEGLREGFDDIGIALQANLKRTPADLERLVPLDPKVRLVKGAYRENAENAHTTRRDVNAAFLKLAGELLSWSSAGRVQPVFATHDTELLAEIGKLAAALGAGPHGYEVHMLYGIRTADLKRLAREGTRVRVLISYGPDWAAWYLRRIAERPANLALAATSLIAKRRE
jgi:proline dehydrogenase